MENAPDSHDVQCLHNRIAELETALADARLDLSLTRAWIRLAWNGPTTAPGHPADGFRSTGLPAPAPGCGSRCAN